MRHELTPEDELWWQQVAQQTQPISHRQAVPAVKQPARAARREGSLPDFKMPDVKAPPLTLGAYAGVDKNTAQRFKGGELPLEGVLDMHGMHREQAHRALVAFVHEHYARGSRCVLAITGKGKKGHDAEGVLRSQLPLWLAEPGLRPLVLACDMARQKHGGSGAYYILLRRKR